MIEQLVPLEWIKPFVSIIIITQYNDNENKKCYSHLCAITNDEILLKSKIKKYTYPKQFGMFFNDWEFRDSLSGCKLHSDLVESDVIHKMTSKRTGHYLSTRTYFIDELTNTVHAQGDDIPSITFVFNGEEEQTEFNLVFRK